MLSQHATSVLHWYAAVISTTVLSLVVVRRGIVRDCVKQLYAYYCVGALCVSLVPGVAASAVTFLV